MLPGVIMSNGGQVFETLYHLASLDQPRLGHFYQNSPSQIVG